MAVFFSDSLRWWTAGINTNTLSVRLASDKNVFCDKENIFRNELTYRNRVVDIYHLVWGRAFLLEALNIPKLWCIWPPQTPIWVCNRVMVYIRNNIKQEWMPFRDMSYLSFKWSFQGQNVITYLIFRHLPPLWVKILLLLLFSVMNVFCICHSRLSCNWRRV